MKTLRKRPPLHEGIPIVTHISKTASPVANNKDLWRECLMRAILKGSHDHSLAREYEVASCDADV